MKRIVLGIMLLAMAATAWAGEDKVIKMSTTTSTQSSGLLDVLLPQLEKDTGIRVKVLAKGTGAAIRDGMDGNVDVIFVHAKSREDKFVKQGYGTKRYPVMHNDFVILGPKNDPARIKGQKSAARAFKKIADKKSLFVSRGDDSGTHTKEQQLWEASGAALKNDRMTIVKKGKKKDIRFMAPKYMGSRYLSVGQGMGKALVIAEEKQGYILCDRGTYLKFKLGRDQGLDLEVLCEGDELLFNPYGVIPISKKKFPHVKQRLANRFAKWLVSSRGQSVIANYRLLNQPLFYPDAITNEN